SSLRTSTILCSCASQYTDDDRGARATDVSLRPPEARLYSAYALVAVIGPSVPTISSIASMMDALGVERGSPTGRASQAAYGSSVTPAGAASPAARDHSSTGPPQMASAAS